MIIVRGSSGGTLKLLTTCLTLSNSYAFKHPEDALSAHITYHDSKVGLRRSSVKRRVVMDDDMILNLTGNTVNTSSVPFTTALPSNPPSSKPTSFPTGKPTTLNPVGGATMTTTKPSPLVSTPIPVSVNPTGKPTSSPTNSNNTVIVSGQGQIMSINQSKEDDNQSQLQAATQESNSVPAPIIISTVILLLICLIGIGVAITAWIVGGPEEEFDEKTQGNEYLPSFFERIMMPTQSELMSPSTPTVDETNTYQGENNQNKRRKSRKRRERKQREVKYDTNKIIEIEKATKEHTTYSWLDRFLDNTISKVC